MGSSASSEVKPGERIGRYLVVRRLAVGGMAEVYLARHEGPKGFSKLVVIKRVLPGLQQADKFTNMFLDEGRLAARLSHPCIAQTFELGEHEGSYFIVMEYVPGESLTRVVRRAASDGRPIPPASLLRVPMQLLEALDYAHDLKGDRGEWLKVVHRDVSPTNVVLTYHGGVKLLDFGIARAAIHEHHTQIGTVKGKGGYMSPEQATAAPVDGRTDLYAVGSLLYLLVTGVGPFDGEPDVFAMMQAAVDMRFSRPSARNPSVNPALEAIILKAMAKRPDDRYPTAGVMLGELEAYAASQRLFPSSRELTTYIRQLFPERAELARSWDAAPDDAVAAKLAESLSEPDEVEASPPTRLARRPRLEEPAAAAKAPSPSGAPAGRTARQAAKTLPMPVEVSTSRGRALAPGAPATRGPVVAAPSHERPTQERSVLSFIPDDEVEDVDEKTAAAFPPKSDQTLSGEHDVEPDPDALTAAGVPPPTGVTAPGGLSAAGGMVNVGQLVASHPWAFVVAGLAAVLLGVAVLWAFGGG